MPKAPPKPSGLAALLYKAVKKETADKAPHLVVKALAGTGKTTTLIEGLKITQERPTTIRPSKQQKAIWDCIAQSSGQAHSFAYTSFTSSIVHDMEGKVPRDLCEIRTIHSMGNQAITLKWGRLPINEDRTKDIICEVVGPIHVNHPQMYQAMERLIELVKVTLKATEDKSPTHEELLELADRYGVELGKDEEAILAHIPACMDIALDVEDDKCIDYNDMIWIPIAKNLPLTKYDILLVDEAQDLNRCQQEIVLRVGNRVIVCGDENQAIFGFTGADCESMSRMESLLQETPRGCETLPLTVTRRCGKAIVAEAKGHVKEFEAHPDNPEGRISHRTMNGYRKWVNEGDLVICRLNAPLVGQCLSFLKEKRPARIIGRDVVGGLITLIKKLMRGFRGPRDTISECDYFIARLEEWYITTMGKEQARREPSRTRLAMLRDRYDCLQSFAAESKNQQDMIDKINSIFVRTQAEGTGIRLASIHKAKGLEAKTVHFLMPRGAECPSHNARLPWEIKQERNLLWVGQTRAIDELVYVT